MLASSACLSVSAYSALRSSSVLAANSSSVARSCSFTAFSRASSAKIVALFSSSSTFMRLIASSFFPGPAKLFLHRLLARFQRKDRGVLFAEFDFHAVDRIGFLAEFGELDGG